MLADLWQRLAVGAVLSACGLAAVAAPVAADLQRRVEAGEAVTVIVEYDARVIDADLAAQRQRLPRAMASDALLASARTRYAALKLASDRRANRPAGLDVVRDHSHLPMRTERVRSAAALAWLASQPDVVAVYEDGVLQPVLAQSLPLVGASATQAVGYGGAGTTVAVIDTTIDLSNAAFGGCTAVGTPASCRIAAKVDFPASPGTDSSHGTNVAATVLGVAPQARVAALDVFSTSGASFSDVVSAINWSIANRSALNIVALNMSLGDGTYNTTTCSSGNVFTTPVANARAAGISVVAASGNAAYVNGVFTAGIARPACTAGVISVGAVYDGNVGGLTWGSSPNQCTDATSAADQVTCFSQTAPILSMLAPGALITAGGITFGGTSQATPHVAGAAAVLRASFTADTLTTTESRLTTNGLAVTDPRNGLSKPRLALALAARPANDALASATVASGANGSSSGENRLATLEAGEPQHAAAGGHSVWWRWTAPTSGQVSLATAGSDFDTLLAVYTGTSVAALAQAGSNDNPASGGLAASLVFQAQSGTTYQWAVDGVAGASGQVALQWALNTAAQADVSASLNGPVQASAGDGLTYTLAVANAGPQVATHARVQLTVPTGVTVTTTPAGCSLAGALLICSVPSLASGQGSGWPVAVSVSSGSGFTLAASVTSDLPDPVPANNAVTLVVAAVGMGGDSADVPAVPPWGMVLLAGVLAAFMQARSTRWRAPANSTRRAG